MSSVKTSSDRPVRVRFAPSPTGYLHVGSIRSGLFNWLWARHNNGKYILRVEDTDRARLVDGALEQIIATHMALGIVPDEGPTQGGEYGPYLQSERLSIYRDHAARLTNTGALYRCWCSPERLTQLREVAQSKGIAFMYDRHCLNPENQRSSKEPHVLRFKVPATPKTVCWDDAVRGNLSFATHTLDDFVAIKADGYPTYHFANVVDDHLMQISHVLRADEWIPSTPKHLLLFEAFDWAPPVYAHLPAVQGPGGHKKLSKRDGAQSVEEYLAEGFLPEALRSFLASLGWNDGSTQEVYDTEQLIEKFTLDRIQKSPAKFDKDRLTWVNGYMVRQMPLDDLLRRIEAFWPASARNYSSSYHKQVLGLVQDRLKYFAEIPELTSFFFEDPRNNSSDLHPQWTQAVIALLSHSNFSESDLEQKLRDLAEQLEIKPGQLFTHIRSLVTGRTVAPGLFETLHVLGQETTLRRLNQA